MPKNEGFSREEAGGVNVHEICSSTYGNLTAQESPAIYKEI